MLFAFPVALFPAMAEQWGGARIAGMLFSSMAIGSLIATLFSGWSTRVRRHGRVVVIAAACWGIFIIGVGLAPVPWLAVLFLILAGGADMISGLFRRVIWNHSVPNAMRGRLSGIAMISYMTGPLLGNTRAGVGRYAKQCFNQPVERRFSLRDCGRGDQLAIAAVLGLSR